MKAKCKIEKYKDGYTLLIKYHWYSKWKRYYENQYWQNFEDIENYIWKDLSMKYGYFIVKYGKEKIDNIYIIKI